MKSNSLLHRAAPWLIAFAFAACGCGSKNSLAPILNPPLDSIRVSPDTLVVSVGGAGQFTAVGYDTNGVAHTNLRFAWTSTDTAHAIVTVDGLGRVHGVSEGAARVFADGGGARDSAVVVVTVAQGGWFAQVSNANGVTLNGLFFLQDGRTGWAVGDGGKIVATKDAGATWALQVSNTSFSLRSVWFTGPRRGWAVGAAGTVLHTVNGGQLWTRVNASSGDILNDVAFGNDTTGWAVGSSGAILRTRNEGRTWTQVNPTPFALNSISFVDTLHGWAVGDAGVIVGTHNGGRSWFVYQPAITAQNLESVWRRSEAVAFAVGAQGVAPRTIVPLADTTRWQVQNAGAANQLHAVSFPNDSTGYAVGFNGAGIVVKTTNRGLAWQSQTSNTQFRLNDVFFVDAQRGWAVGANGTILHTGTGGAP